MRRELLKLRLKSETMLGAKAHIFSGQGFEYSELKKLKNIDFPSDISEIYEEIFRDPLPSLSSLTVENFGKNEVSVALLLTSAFSQQQTTQLVTKPKVLAGYSVGQYLALHAAQVIERHDLIKILFMRCNAMNKAARRIPGAMAAVLGMQYGIVEKIAAEQSVFISNNNAPGNITVAGEKQKIVRFCEIVLKYGAYKALILNTSGAWHCELMQPAVAELEDVILPMEFKPPKIPVVDNVTGVELDFSDIKKSLLLHLVSEVKWSASIRYMLNKGVTEFIEQTHFSVLTKIGPFINRKAKWL